MNSRHLLLIFALGASPFSLLAGESVPPTPKAPASENAAEAAPAKSTERSVMFRRLCIDILGRMPTPQEMDEFLKDTSPEAYGRAVNRLLTSEQNASTKPAALAKDVDRLIVANLQDKAASLISAQQRALAERARADAEIAAMHARVAEEQSRAAEARQDLRHTAITAPRMQTWLRAVNAAPKKKAAYLGIGVDVPTDTVRSQLRLDPGAGLVVNHVDENGPSAKLVQVHDVLQKLDDQILVNGEQLVTLIRMHKQNDAVKLTLIRQAKPVTVEVKLGEREIEVGLVDVADRDLSLEYTARPLNLTFQNLAAYRQPVTDATFSPNFNTFTFRGVRAGPVQIDDGRLKISLPADDSQEMVVHDAKTGKMIYRGPPITGENDPHAKQLPDDVRSSIIGWQNVVAQQAGGVLLLASPATQPAKSNE